MSIDIYLAMEDKESELIINVERKKKSRRRTRGPYRKALKS
ncbi:MAG: hypothetical protein QXG05_08370 [Nitrososphaerota archaeon]